MWPGGEQAIVVLVSSHTTTQSGVYDQLLDALGIEMPADDRKKPACCDEDGEPPVNALIATFIAEAIDRRAGRGRRGR